MGSLLTQCSVMRGLRQYASHLDIPSDHNLHREEKRCLLRFSSAGLEVQSDKMAWFIQGDTSGERDNTRGKPSNGPAAEATGHRWTGNWLWMVTL